MTLTEKAAYIKGMMEGMAFEPQTNEDKLLKAVVDLLDDMASDLSKLREQVADVNEYVEELDDDLAQVESVLEEDEDDYDDEDEDEDVFEVTCPYCGETVYFEDSIDPDHIPCPACGKTFDIEQAACGDCDSDSCEGCVLEETHHLDDEV